MLQIREALLWSIIYKDKYGFIRTCEGCYVTLQTCCQHSRGPGAEGTEEEAGLCPASAACRYFIIA